MTTQTPGAEPGRKAAQAPACAECGTLATPGHSFCDGCGAVLRWSPGNAEVRAAGAGAAPAAPAEATAPAAAAAPAAPAEPAEPADRGAQHHASPPVAASQGPGAPGGPEGSGPGPTPAPGAAAPDGGGEEDTEPLAALTDRDREQDRARALLVPVADPEQRVPEAHSVAPVLPGRPAAARPLVSAPGQEPDDGGGALCPWCGTGNRPDRHFCRRCAMTMAGRPEDPARRPWWRRLGFGNREVPWAGDRPRLRRGLGRVLTWVAGAAALTLLVVAAFQVGPAGHAVRDHFAKRAPVAPDSVRASASFSGHGPSKAFDKINNTWWGPGVSQSGDGEWIEARFQQPTRLLDVLITPGISTQPSDLSKAALPHRIEARITAADGHTSTRFLTLDQSSGAQRRSFRVGSVTAVRFILRSAYGISTKKQVSIAEIELFGRSTSGNS
ncbi:NADase-type glycan-binding domain-containing protein [Streptomyces sp. NBC_00344]|uniref:NADase-type glycan-binding domain-containing protein n=1 Tax=Streptomyces sp. NBC_00344 TaxID=2975720 RepID=UPI002E1AF67F